MTTIPLIFALLLDARFGEPPAIWSLVPHPAVAMGRMIDRAERTFNTGNNRRLKGTGIMVCLVLAALTLGRLIADLPFGSLIEALVGAALLAQRSLVQHVQAVADALRRSTDAGRQAVAQIVGRDTSGMDNSAIARAAIESAAENLSDGVIAPAFWFLVGGLPGLLIYKLTNTADSMIGHRTPRHEDFGWAAARFDDLLNLIPARLTALLIALAQRRTDIFRAVARDAVLHRSPNAGWPEAAMAITLDTALSGPRSYAGQMQDFPWVWAVGNHTPGPDQIDACVAALWRVWRLTLGGLILLAFLQMVF